MDPRRFDALARALSGDGRTPSRRRLLTALPMLAAVAITPSLVRAFDAGEIQRTPTPGQTACTGAADCPTGQVCIDGVCGLLSAVGGRADAPAIDVGTTPVATTQPAGDSVTPVATTQPAVIGGAPTPTPRAVLAPDEEPTAEATIEAAAGATPAPAIGGGAVAVQPLPAGIFRGACGSLEAEPAFPLIEIGTDQAIAPPELPEGAPGVAEADFSSTIVSTTLGGILDEPHAFDIRLVGDDPATSVACGNVTGTPEAGVDGEELVIPLAEQNGSGASGVAFVREEEGERLLTYVFVTRSDEAAETGVAVGTPVAAEGFRRGDTVVTLSDVNLRAAPSTEAAVVEVLGTGVELDVTVDARDGWVPVLEPDSDSRGFVAADTVELAPPA
jgi:hypothetical protein